MARTLRSDKTLFWATLALVCTSIVMVVSATPKLSELGSTALKQLGLAGVGIVALLVMMRVDYHQWRRPSIIWSLLGVTILGLGIVFLFEGRNNAQRWIPMPGMTLQPSELAKLTAILFAAAILERRMHRINDVGYSLAPIGVVTAVLAFLIVKEPDLGTAAVLVLAVLAMVFAAGLSWRYLAGVSLLMLPVLMYFIMAYSWRVERILAFWRPGTDSLTTNWQLTQSKIALGSGGAFGLGLANGKQKLFWLPESHNDFIFAVIGEELGLIGTTAILICFAVIAWRGLRAALLAPDRFGTLLGIGIAMMIAMQAFINMAVVTGLAPTKGIPLPLVSQGGSSLLVTLVAMGILLNISQQASASAATSMDAR